ncbi:MAG: hypothetical protein K8R46_00180 [Pirellulales bacterium]|nr:hypothetical protein [Pirellulales bacterium]
MADSDPERFEDDLDEVSSAVKRCVGHTASLQRWAYNEEELDPVLEVHGLLESFAEAQSGLGFVEDALAGAVDQPADFGGVVRESHHGTAHALADRTLQAVADSLGSLLIGPGPGPNGPTGQWKANIPGIYAVGRQDYPKIRRTLAALPRFDPDLLTAWLKKERVWGKRQYSATPPQAKPEKGEGNNGNAAQKNRDQRRWITTRRSEAAR